MFPMYRDLQTNSIKTSTFWIEGRTQCTYVHTS